MGSVFRANEFLDYQIDKLTHVLLGICYNIRYFEKHGRDLEDPWSCRQSALHHSFSINSEQSTWVIVQAPEALQVVLGWEQRVMSLHIRYLRAGIANWRQYLDWFAQRFRILVS